MRRYNPLSRLRLAALVLCLATMAGEAHAAYRYRLTLRDKAGADTITLSPRALARRAAQGIALDSLDVDLSPTYVEALRQAGLQEVTRSRWLNTIVVQRSNGAAISDTLWQHLPFVVQHKRITSYQTFNYAPAADGRDVQPLQRANPSKYGTLKPAAGGDPGRGTTESYRTPIYELKGQALLDNGYSGQGMLIAVLDAGFRNVDKRDHLRRNVVGWRDMYRPGTQDSTYIYGSQADSHGAECMSTMASDPTHGVWGTAPDAQFFLIRTEYVPSETPLEEDMWIAGAELADSLGADLISSSLGYFEFDDASLDYTQSQLGTGVGFITRGAMAATSRGMIVVNAAGNEGGDWWNAIDFPSDAAEVMCVGGTTPYGTVASFSSPGFLQPWVKPDVVCRGQSAYVISTYSGNVMQGDGTSYATPMMCGLIASLWSAAPSLTAQQIRDIVRQSGDHYTTPDRRWGYGRPNFKTALQAAQELENVLAKPVVRPDEGQNNSNGKNRTGLYDLYGRRLATPPASGPYIRNGRIVVAD